MLLVIRMEERCTRGGLYLHSLNTIKNWASCCRIHVTFITVKRDFAGMALSCQMGKGCKKFSTACSIFCCWVIFVGAILYLSNIYFKSVRFCSKTAKLSVWIIKELQLAFSIHYAFPPILLPSHPVPLRREGRCITVKTQRWKFREPQRMALRGI
jgi:hypothetical protein